MNLPTYIIPSDFLKGGIAGLTAILLLGCGGSAPPPEREFVREGSPTTIQNPIGEKGAGGINFHYSNKSTDARMDIDLGTTDVYLEMSGQVVNPEDQRVVPPLPQDKPIAPPVHPMESEAPKPANEPERKPKFEARDLERDKDQDLDQDQNQVKNEEVMGRVLAGIRKAQELFYQKRYPEALQMVRQSLDAQPSAEGHALAGSICYMMNKMGLARRHWEEALRLNPDMPAVVNMLERTRTPGGRGSPSPRPLFSKEAPKAPTPVIEASGTEVIDQAPFPEAVDGEIAPVPKVLDSSTVAPSTGK